MATKPSSYCLSTAFAEIVLGYAVSILAVFTIFTHFSQILEITFLNYAIIGSIIVFSLLTLSFRFAYKRLKQIRNRDYIALLLLVSLGVLCSLIALGSHRTTADDYFYTPNAVYMLENPSDAMSFEIHFLDGGEKCTIVSHTWGTSLPFEYTQGAVADIFGLAFLTVYYVFTPALIGFLIPVALYYALSVFSEEQTIVTVAGTFVTIGIVLLLGETLQTFGNYSLTRAYEGKTLLLAVGIPLFVGATINFLKFPSLYYWALLFAIATAMVGASASAIPVLLSLASVLAVAHLVSSNRRQQKTLTYFAYFMSFWYVAIYALFILTNSETNLGINSPVNQGWPTSFFGQLGSFIDRRFFPATPLVVIISSLSAIYFAPKKIGRVLIFWIAAVVILYLNPLVAPAIIKYLTSPNIYWRLFYVYPFPLVIGISTIYIIKKIRTKRRESQIIMASLLILGLVGISSFLFPTSAFKFHNTFRFPPIYKLPMKYLDIAERVTMLVPEGTMLAPPKLSGLIPMLSSKYPQVTVSRKGLNLWLSECGKPQQTAALRTAASRFVGGNPNKFPEFLEFLNTEGEIIRSIVIDKKSAEVETVKESLGSHQLIYQAEVGDYFVFWK